MVSVMTTHLPSTLVAYAGGKLCEHLTAAQARYPASISSYDLRPKPTFAPRKDFRTMSGVLAPGRRVCTMASHTNNGSARGHPATVLTINDEIAPSSQALNTCCRSLMTSRPSSRPTATACTEPVCPVSEGDREHSHLRLRPP
jgi:hypothetical protein